MAEKSQYKEGKKTDRKEKVLEKDDRERGFQEREGKGGKDVERRDLERKGKNVRREETQQR
jgi:hypothetical protein